MDRPTGRSVGSHFQAWYPVLRIAEGGGLRGWKGWRQESWAWEEEEEEEEVEEEVEEEEEEEQ
jgi:hypothetical protein